MDVPLIVILPADAVKLPATLRFPLIVSVLAVVTVPDTVRLSTMMPVPLIVLLVPLIVSAPPVLCVKVPDPVVARFPETVSDVDEQVIFEALRFRL